MEYEEKVGSLISKDEVQIATFNHFRQYRDGTSDVVDALAPIPANTNIRLAITAVGITYPGTDLTVFVYS